MKILFAATPIAGHLHPLLAIARMARERGDDVLMTTGSALRPAVEAAGARFSKLMADADLDLSRMEEVWPERLALPPGPGRVRFDFEHIFIKPLRPQAETLRRLVDEERPDVIVADEYFFGATALFLDQVRWRPPIVACSITVLAADRPDGAPVVLGLPPASDEQTRVRYSALAAELDASFGMPVRASADAQLAELGLPPLPCSFLNSRHLMADAYLHATVPAFEYDYGVLPSHVRFVGALPPPPYPGSKPAWWDDVFGGRPVILVTQGTVANADFSELVEPTIAALADRDDLLVVVTTGGRDLDDVRGVLPDNARLAKFLDYEALLPMTSVLVTNGGYGTVSSALRAGVPIVAAGRTEDKAEVGARVAWSGVGLEIPSQAPSPVELRRAIGKVLGDGRFEGRAREIAADMRLIDTRAAILGVLDELVDPGARRDGAR